jgi:hypothetical protein
MLSLVEAQLSNESDACRKLLEVFQSVFDGRLEDAGASLEKRLNAATEAELAQSFAWSLAASFVSKRFDLAAKLLRNNFSPRGRVVVKTTDLIECNFVVLFVKVADHHIELIFSKLLETYYDSMHVHMLFVEWVMPLLAAAGSSTKVPPGATFLNQHDEGLIPGLSYSANKTTSFLIPDTVFIPTKGYDVRKRELAKGGTSWPNRQGIAFWRGSTTGHPWRAAEGWRSLQRIALCELSRFYPQHLDAGLSGIVQVDQDSAEQIAKSGFVKEFFPSAELHKYKYLVDIDGNTNAWSGLFEKLITGSVVLKVQSPRGCKQWYYGKLRAWHNYVPVSEDMIDVAEIVNWLREHDDEARMIGENGRALAYSMDYDSEVAGALETIAAAFRAFAVMRTSTISKYSFSTFPAVAKCVDSYLELGLGSESLAHSPRNLHLLYQGSQSPPVQWIAPLVKTRTNVDAENPPENSTEIAPYKLLERIAFGEGGNAEEALGVGWFGPENEFRWTDGNVSELWLNNWGKLDTIIEFEAWPTVKPPELLQQRIEIEKDGLFLGSLVFSAPARQAMYVPGSAPMGGSKSKLCFGLPNAIRPIDIGTADDYRQLGLAFFNVSVYKAPGRAHYQKVGPVGIDASSMTERYELPPGHLIREFEPLAESVVWNLRTAVGLKPLGLMLDMSIPLVDLVRGIENSFAGLGEVTRLRHELFDERPDIYQITDELTNLTFLAHRTKADSDSGKLLARYARRLEHWRFNLLYNARVAEKIFVYRPGPHDAVLDEPFMLPLLIALRQHGPNKLLFVTPEDQSHPPGTVEQNYSGLLRGYLNATEQEDTELTKLFWLEILSNALALQVYA